LLGIEQGPFILFLGEAPGNHEDITGLPFQGRAGMILNWCLSLCTTTFHFEITNIVACRPTKWGINDYSVINRTPSPQEIKACMPRVQELTDDVTYDAIVYLGATAREFSCPKGLSSLSLPHPTAILRKEYKWHDVKEFALLLDRFVEKLTSVNTQP
jgi:uracil-DNA glycosylase family 4